MSKQAFIPSKYQQALFDFIKNEQGNALVSAVAGSGKSTSLIKAMTLIPMTKSVHFFAFGRDIVADLKTKIPSSPNITISTIHSYGMRSVMRGLVNKPELDDRKYHKLVDDSYIDMKDGTDTLGAYRGRVLPLIHLIRVNMCRTWEDAKAMSDKYDLCVTDNDCQQAMAVIRVGLKELHSMDMTDMIWLPVALDMKVDRFDFVMVDECQDLSELQRALVMKSVKPKGRYIAVGDERQAIFGFAGADAESFDKFRSMPNTKQLPLSVCYRCPREVIDLAKTLVPHIECRDSEINSTENTVKRDAKLVDIKAGDLILCRNTYPLVKLGFQYIAAGVKARIAGRDIGKNLISMIRNTKAGSFDDMYDKFAVELGKIESELMRIKGMNKEEAVESSPYQTYKDKVDAIRVVSEGCTSINELTSKIDGIFSDDNGDGILLSTIHKSKGLEADNVYIIHEDMMPSKNAKLPWAKVQEQNLIYVAYTRAKRKLGFVCDFNAYGASGVLKSVSKSEPAKAGDVPTGKKLVVGEVITDDMEIINITPITSSFGTTKKYIMKDSNNNVITKIGSMSGSKIISGNGLNIGSVVKLKAPVKNITVFNGAEEINLGMLVPV